MTSQETSSRTAKEAEDELAHTLRVMTRLQEIAALYVQAGNLQPILLAIVDAAIEFADADYGNIQLIDSAGTLRIAAHRGFPQWWLDFWNSVNHGNGACGTALERAERVIVEDVEKDPIFIGTEGLDTLLKVGVRAVQSTPLVSRSGKPLGMFSTHYRASRRPDDGALRLLDILARQAAEIIDRAQAEIALRNSEERLRVALDASRAGSWSWDVNTNASIWDDRFLEMYEFPTNVVQRFDTWAGRLHPDDQERILSRIAQMQVTPGDDRWLEEFRCVLPEGGIVWHMGVGQAQRDRDGRFNGLTGIVIDITQRKAAEEAFARSQKMEALGKLTGGIAHDMNNLFLVIYGNLELAEAGLGNSAAKHAIGKALTAIQQGSNLNQRLLAFASRLSLAPKRISLNSSISEIALLLRRTLGEHIELETKLDDTLWQTLVDPGEFDSAIINIAVNARDAMPSGGKLSISTRNSIIDQTKALAVDVQPGAYVCATMSDNGHGMSPDVLRRAVEPFFTTKDVGKGSGLGLSSVYGFARQTGGFVEITSQVGRGTEVSVYLPRAPDSSKSGTMMGADGVPVGTGQRVLVAEDHEQVREVTLARLDALGYVPIEARNGKEALDILAGRDDIDVLLSDVIMPGGVTGYDLADWVASQRPRLKVLLMSGYNEIVMEREPNSGPGVLAKPYTRAALAHALHNLLQV